MSFLGRILLLFVPGSLLALCVYKIDQIVISQAQDGYVLKIILVGCGVVALGLAYFGDFIIKKWAPK